MGKYQLQYKITRFFFGFIMLCLGLRGILDYKTHSALLAANLKDYGEKDGFSSIFTFEWAGESVDFFLRGFFKFDVVAKNCDDTIVFIYSLLSLGGFMCLLGHAFSKYLLVSSIVLDLIFVHNFRFFATDSSKGLMLKYIAFLGGTMHIA